LDTGTGRHLRNFPQAFSHLALIEAAGGIIYLRVSARHGKNPAKSAVAPQASDRGLAPRALQACPVKLLRFLTA
jgi:hypothetical protein